MNLSFRGDAMKPIKITLFSDVEKRVFFRSKSKKEDDDELI